MGLTELLNVGQELARCLKEAGVYSPEELRRVGSIEAAIRISPYRPDASACRSALCALEGALRGMRWHSVTKADRDKLWKQYQLRTGNC